MSAPTPEGSSTDTALRLARYFQTTDRFWLNLQARFDLEVERDRLGARLEREVAVLTRRSRPTKPLQPTSGEHRWDRASMADAARG